MRCSREVATADPLQSWAWSEAGIATGERWDRLLVSGADGRPVAAVQWQLVSPVLGHPLAYAPHGPVWRADDEASTGALRALLTAMREQADAAGASAILVDPRGGLPGQTAADPSSVSADLGFEASSRHVQMPSTRVLDLRHGLDASRATWDKDTRNLVRRSTREGVEVESVRADDGPAVEALHRLMLDGRVAGQLRAALGAVPRGVWSERGRPGVHLPRRGGRGGSSRVRWWGSWAIGRTTSSRARSGSPSCATPMLRMG